MTDEGENCARDPSSYSSLRDSDREKAARLKYELGQLEQQPGRTESAESSARVVPLPWPNRSREDLDRALTEAVRRRPYSVVLFDEVEKAHPEVLNVLLQLLDDGRLTDAQGRTVNFKNTIAIMTSNLGSQYISEPGLEWESIRKWVIEVVRQCFRPELLNRIDEIDVFHPLALEQIERIVEIQLRSLRKRLEAPVRGRGN
jgi:MoxR-like ATPase